MKVKEFIKKILHNYFTDDIRGISLHDPFWSSQRKHYIYQKAIRDGSQLFIETRGIVEQLFPYQSKDEEMFSILANDDKIRLILERYFINDDNSSNLYGESGLTDWFKLIAYDLLMFGKSYFYIEWEQREIDNHKLFLPIYFHKLPIETVFEVNLFNKKLYLQLYHPITILREKYNKLKNRIFKSMNILKFNYDETPLIKQALPLVKQKLFFFENGIKKQKANLDTENYEFSTQKAKYSNSTQEYLKFLITNGRIYKTMKYKETSGYIPTTEYYNLYTRIRYLKDQNNFRDLILDTFQTQIISRVAKNNNLNDLQIKFTSNFVRNNSQLDELFAKYKEHQISLDDIVKAVLN